LSDEPYSHSRLSCFEQCPRRYELRYVQQVEVEEMQGIEAFAGSVVHLALQHLYEGTSRGGTLGLGDLIEHFDRLWQEMFDDSVKVVKRGMTPADYHDAARTGLVAYHRRYDPFDQGVTVALEHEVRFKVRGEREHEMIGYIDRLTSRGEGWYEVHDYKTGRKLPSPQQLKDDRQLALYEMGVRQAFPEAREVKLVWHYLAHDREMTSSRTREELGTLEKSVSALIERIETAGSFPCRRGPLCSWCEYAELCR
jgi:putative RecB family exonuclease